MTNQPNEKPTLDDLVLVLSEVGNYMAVTGKYINDLVNAGLIDHLDPEKAPKQILDIIAKIHKATEPLKEIAESLNKQ